MFDFFEYVVGYELLFKLGGRTIKQNNIQIVELDDTPGNEIIKKLDDLGWIDLDGSALRWSYPQK